MLFLAPSYVNGIEVIDVLDEIHYIDDTRVSFICLCEDGVVREHIATAVEHTLEFHDPEYAELDDVPF